MKKIIDKSKIKEKEISAIDIFNKKNELFKNPIFANASDDEKLLFLNLVKHWIETEIFKIKHK